MAVRAPESAELVRAAAAGDRASFESLVRAHADAVYAHAHRFFGDAQTAEDATQEVWIKVFRSLPDFDGRAAFSTWLFRVTRNVCLDMLQARAEDRHAARPRRSRGLRHRRHCRRGRRDSRPGGCAPSPGSRGPRGVQRHRPVRPDLRRGRLGARRPGWHGEVARVPCAPDARHGARPRREGRCLTWTAGKHRPSSPRCTTARPISTGNSPVRRRTVASCSACAAFRDALIRLEASPSPGVAAGADRARSWPPSTRRPCRTRQPPSPPVAGAEAAPAPSTVALPAWVPPWLDAEAPLGRDRGFRRGCGRYLAMALVTSGRAAGPQPIGRDGVDPRTQHRRPVRRCGRAQVGPLVGRCD